MPSDPGDDWRRNLAVCLFGSFSTVFAMTLILPFLPLYVEQLSVRGHAAVVQWSGIAYGATFLTAGICAPLWGHLGDRYGRKPMLVRVSLGMAITMSLIGFSTNVWQLVGLRLLAGIAGGYSSGSTIVVAVQTPRGRSGWALGMLSSGVMAGNLIGPLVGGSLPQIIGIRETFWGVGALIFVAFLATTLLIKEAPRTTQNATSRLTGGWSQIPHQSVVVAMLATGLLLMFANMSIEPIITVYVRTLVADPRQVTFIAGLVMSAAALGSILSASYLGKLADRIGHSRVIIHALIVAALLLIPQTFVATGWQLIALRFLMGLALGGLLPCITAVVRHNVPDHCVGSVLGYSLSSQFAGQVTGPLVGGFIGGHIGMRAVFLGTSALLLVGALQLARGWHRQARLNRIFQARTETYVAGLPPLDPEKSALLVIDFQIVLLQNLVTPAEVTPVVVKHRVGAFTGTELGMLLKAGGVETLILAGITTGGVVLSTVRQGFDLDYELIVADDCCADHDTEVHNLLLGKVIPQHARVISAVKIEAALC
jgi:MFS family permease